MDWFEALWGFKESSQAVYRYLQVRGDKLHSLVNNRSLQYGRLDMPSLAQLRAQVAGFRDGTPLRVREIVADARELHLQSENHGAVFQVASQFNLLEMISPDVTPEHGVTDYALNPTQGPTCAMACAAGTVFRNYFVPVEGDIGQTENRQIDCVREFGERLGKVDEMWTMKNGYALGKVQGLKEAGDRVKVMGEVEKDRVREALRVGVQWDTEVTVGEGMVTQVYCAAFPVGYAGAGADVWEQVARVLLEALYEATLLVGVLNRQRGGQNVVYLTLVGGGVFGNRLEWILDAMRWAFDRVTDCGLDVRVVSYKDSKPEVKALER